MEPRVGDGMDVLQATLAKVEDMLFRGYFERGWPPSLPDDRFMRLYNEARRPRAPLALRRDTRAIAWQGVHREGPNKAIDEETWKAAYAASSLLVVDSMLDKAGCALADVLEALDMVLIVCGPIPQIQDICTRIHRQLEPCVSDVRFPGHFETRAERTSGVAHVVRPPPALFLRAFMRKAEPCVILESMEHWPGLNKWGSLQYFMDILSWRTLPVEVGQDYAEDAWTQIPMRFKTFVEKYLVFPEQHGYLAQYALFDHVPQLKCDIVVPDFCSLSLDGETKVPQVSTNAWFGPKGTKSRCHHDPCHNLLCQVIGRKRVKLIHPKYSENLYPLPQNSKLSNTSRIRDLDLPVQALATEFPKFPEVQVREVVLYPGQMLYIPPGYWHYVVSLDTSFSVSFWWS